MRSAPGIALVSILWMASIHAQPATLAGSWVGNSTCVDRQRTPACRDEWVRFVFTQTDGGSGAHLDAQKRVADRYETMFEIDLARDSDGEWKHTFDAPNGIRGRWSFRLAGPFLAGKLVDADSGAVLRNVSAHRAERPMPDLEKLDPFGRAAALAVGKVGKFDEMVSLGVGPAEDAPKFALPGAGLGQFEQVACEQARPFGIFANHNEQARIVVGACRAETVRVARLAAGAQAANRRVVEALLANAPDSRERFEALLKPVERSLPNGVKGLAFTSVIVGHGILLMHTAVVEDPRSATAYLVQADMAQLCGESAGPEARLVPSPFCPATKQALLEVALELARSLPPKR